MKFLPFLFFCVLFNNVLVYGQLSKGDRTFAWQVEASENDDYAEAFNFAKAGCMESVHLSLTWSDLEPEEGIFDTEIITNILDIANIYFPANGVSLELQLAVTNTVVKEVPADLIDTEFSDPEMISRFKTALDTIFAHIPDLDIASLNIGNESDILFGVDESAYASFKIFLDEIAPYARDTYFDLYGSSIKVGTTLTLEGLTDPARTTLCQTLNENLDIISTTYYPLDSDYTMLSPDVVEADFDDLVEIYSDPSQPIYFAECGYSSSEICNSSEALQAQFYREVFRVWDKHYANIKYLTVFKSTDWSPASIEIFSEYYGIDDPIFLEYLRALGVRTWDGDGENKLAYEHILCELESREWCTVDCGLTNLEDQNEAKTSFSLYPNPAQDIIHIETNTTIVHIQIYDTHGQLVLSQLDSTINLANLSNGIYVIKISSEEGELSTQKFSIQH